MWHDLGRALRELQERGELIRPMLPRCFRFFLGEPPFLRPLHYRLARFGMLAL